MFWLLAVSFLLFVSGLLWFWWKREAGIELPKSCLIVVLLAAVLGSGSYLLLGMHRDLPDWLSDVWEYEAVANAVAQGEKTLDDTRDIPPAVLARVLQKQLHQHDTAQGWYQLGQLWTELGADRMVELSAERAAQMDPTTPDYTLLWAQSLIQQADGGLTDAAEQKIRDVLAQYPEHEGAWAMLASAGMRAGKYEVALEGWNSLLASHGDGEVSSLLRRMKDQAQQLLEKQRHFSPVTVEVSAESLRAGGTLFVFLRKPGSQGQPMAARRLVADRFPLTVEITDSDWLQEMPDAGVILEAGARYSMGVAGVEGATHTTPAAPLSGKAGQLRASITLQ